MNLKSIWDRIHSGKKPTMVALTDPVEIESARMNGSWDLQAFEIEGRWYAYDWELARWRKRNRVTVDQGT
jgi:hypothetical protein